MKQNAMIRSTVYPKGSFKNNSNQLHSSFAHTGGRSHVKTSKSTSMIKTIDFYNRKSQNLTRPVTQSNKRSNEGDV